jgi:glycosyltransferase A (GT-A) superfamily protein (DUF2064 family)
MENRTDASSCVGGAIVVVAKCPVAGTSKTRLVPMLGEEGAASLARAMLMDTLSSLSECVGYNFYNTLPAHEPDVSRH